MWIHLLQVGEEKLVLEIGQAAFQHPDAKPYVHDLLLSMALAEVRQIDQRGQELVPAFATVLLCLLFLSQVLS